MKIVSISDALQFRDDDGIMRCDVTDLNKIVAGIDRAKGRNDALVAYVYALRDLQRANDLYAILDNSPSAASAIDRAEERVRATLSELVMAQLALLAQLCARREHWNVGTSQHLARRIDKPDRPSPAVASRMC